MAVLHRPPALPGRSGRHGGGWWRGDYGYCRPDETGCLNEVGGRRGLGALRRAGRGGREDLTACPFRAHCKHSDKWFFTEI